MLVDDFLGQFSGFMYDYLLKSIEASPFIVKYVMYLNDGKDLTKILFENREVENEILDWCNANLKHGFVVMPFFNAVYLEDKDDAVLWRLRWN